MFGISDTKRAPSDKHSYGSVSSHSQGVNAKNDTLNQSITVLKEYDIVQVIPFFNRTRQGAALQTDSIANHLGVTEI